MDNNFTIVDKTVVLTAKRNSGKTVLLKYIVSREKNKFSKIFLFCPSEPLNHDYENSGLIKKDCIFENYSEEWMASLFKSLAKINCDPKKPKKKVLLIMDDICSDNDFHNANPHFRRIYSRGRHLSISIIITTQFLHQIPPICRNNCDYLFCGQMNRSSIEILASEFLAGHIDKRQFIKMYNDSTKDYNFLCINNNSVKDNADLDAIYGIVKTPDNFVR
jgi:hypothetical protein